MTMDAVPETFRCGDLTLRATRWGRGSTAGVIVLLHGLGFHRFEFQRLGPLLAERTGQACFAFDFRGHGHSDGVRGRWVLADLLADARSALDHLSTSTRGPVSVYGNSLGALVGLHLAATDNRVHRLVASSCPARVADFASSRWRTILLRGLTLLDRVAPIRVSVNWFDPYKRILTDPAVRRRVAADPLISDARRLSVATYRDILTWTALDIAPKITISVLVLAATRDRFQPITQSTMLADALSNAATELRLLDTGHVPNLEAPELLAPVLAAWFATTGDNSGPPTRAAKEPTDPSHG